MVRRGVAADSPAVSSLLGQIPSLPRWQPADLALDACTNGHTPPMRAVLVLTADPVGQDEPELRGVAQYSVLGGEAEIELIAVHPQYRRHGIGMQLLQAVLQAAAARNAQVIRLEVRSQNDAALALYAAAGFAVVGRRKRYYREPADDAIVLQRRLQP